MSLDLAPRASHADAVHPAWAGQYRGRRQARPTVMPDQSEQIGGSGAWL